MSDQNNLHIDAGGTEAHASNPLVASYDIVDFLTTLAFAASNIANSSSIAFPMLSNVLHLINYSLLCYIQGHDMNALQMQEIAELENREGTIRTDEEYETIRSELMPPKKDGKSQAEYAWDYAIYILKLMACVLLITLSVISTAAVSGAVAAFVNGALFPIAYILTCTVNALKFGMNFVKGFYKYFKKNASGESEYSKHHKVVDEFEERYPKNSDTPHEIPTDELQEYLDARNAINKTGRNNIQNGIFLGLDTTFLAGSLLFLLASSTLFTAVVPPVGITIGSAIFAGIGVILAAHGISVIRNLIRKKRGLPEKKTFFGWITDKFYPEVNAESLKQQGLNYTITPTIELSDDEEITLDDIPAAAPIMAPVKKPAPIPTSSLLTSYSTVGFFNHARDMIKNDNIWKEKLAPETEAEKLKRLVPGYSHKAS